MTMPAIIKACGLGVPSDLPRFRKNMGKLGRAMLKVQGHTTKRDFPVKNAFGEGLYIREFSCPADQFFVTMIHKYDHPFFLMEGEVSVMSENGMERMIGPRWGITKAGTQRVMLTHTKITWITVHATRETSIPRIFKQLTAKTFKEFEKSKGV
jgi:hypothetical protein